MTRGYFQTCGCCGGEFSDETGARQFIYHILKKLEHGVIFTTIVPYKKGSGAACTDREAFRKAWVEQTCGKAMEFLRSRGKEL